MLHSLFLPRGLMSKWHSYAQFRSTLESCVFPIHDARITNESRKVLALCLQSGGILPEVLTRLYAWVLITNSFAVGLKSRCFSSGTENVLPFITILWTVRKVHGFWVDPTSLACMQLFESRHPLFFIVCRLVLKIICDTGRCLLVISRLKWNARGPELC